MRPGTLLQSRRVEHAFLRERKPFEGRATPITLLRSMRRFSFALLLFVIAAAKPAPKAYFQFQSSYWVNLHQTLFREAVRLGSKQPIQPLNTAALTADELATWNKAVQYYQQHFRGKRLVFDDELTNINDALEQSPNPNSTVRVPRGIKAELKAASPIYKRAWWPEQQRQDQQWIGWAAPLVAKYAPEVVPQLEEKFQSQWPAYPLRVDVSYFVAELGGAYTTDHPPHTTLSSVRVPQDWYGLEIVFHEASHPLAEKLEADLGRECAAQKKDCGDLWHAVQFYTVGDVVRRALKKRGISYDTYAEHNGLYKRGQWPRFKKALDQAWPAYLEGKTDWKTAIHELVTAYQP
jgi:hypothetical protein